MNTSLTFHNVKSITTTAEYKFDTGKIARTLEIIDEEGERVQITLHSPSFENLEIIRPEDTRLVTFPLEA